MFKGFPEGHISSGENVDFAALIMTLTQIIISLHLNVFTKLIVYFMFVIGHEIIKFKLDPHCKCLDVDVKEENNPNTI